MNNQGQPFPMPPTYNDGPTQQLTGQMPGPQQAPSFSGFSQGAVGAGGPPVPGVNGWGNQPPASGGYRPGNTGRKGGNSLIILLIAVILLIVVIASAGYVYVNRVGLGAKGQGTQGPLTTSPSTKSSIATATPPPAATATPPPAATATPPPAATTTPKPTPTVTPKPVPFSVTGINVSANPSAFHGACTDPMIFTFTATIKVPAGTAGGTVAYHWLRSDGASAPTETVTFNPGVTTQTVTTTWQLGAVWGNGSTFWEALQVTAPNSVTSKHANFSFVCF